MEVPMEERQREGRPSFVPASIQRVRCYLNTRGGMKVKPWAGVEDTLDAFTDALASQRKDGDFWRGLEALLAALTTDMKRRADDRGGGVIPNELLDSAAHAALLDEIRRKLDGRGPGRGRFRRLAASLSAPALGLAVILGSATTAGCYSSSDLEGEADAAAEADASAEADAAAEADASADPAADPRHEPDLAPPDVTPDAVPDPVVDPAVDPACDARGATLEEILAVCDISREERQYYLDCIDELHASWRTGLTELFACESCGEVLRQLRECLDWRCYNPGTQGPFDLDDFLDNCAVLLYLGVRFE
jgi:hypothetical protein